MSTTSKSPVKAAKAAYEDALATLPEYAHRFSPRKFTQPPLFVCLNLKTFFNMDYRGIFICLPELSDLHRAFDLTVVPQYTTLQQAAKWIVSAGQCAPMIGRVRKDLWAGSR